MEFGIWNLIITHMRLAAYIIFIGLILLFLFYASLSILHAFRFSYLSRRTHPISFIFIGASAFLIIIGMVFLFSIDWKGF